MFIEAGYEPAQILLWLFGQDHTTPLKNVFSFSHLLVLCDILCYALCFPCVFHLAASTLSIFSNKDAGGKGRFFPGDLKG